MTLSHIVTPARNSREFMLAKLDEHDDAISALQGGGGGNATIANLHDGGLIRYDVYPAINALAGASETTALYARLAPGFGPVFPQYGLYVEVPTSQNYTGGGAGIKILHGGHGDASYVAVLSGTAAKTITAMTGNGVTPIVCTVTAHGFGQGDIVQISGCTGNTAANGTWNGITIIDANSFSLPASTGNGTYGASSGTAADTVPPIAYEAAAFANGSVGYLSSMQVTGGASNWQPFIALCRQPAILNYAGYAAFGFPNNAFSASKQTGMTPASIDGYPQFQLTEPPVRMTGGDGGGTYRGDWSAAFTYSINDTVTSGNFAYICTLGHTNHIPPNGTYWTDVTDTANASRLRIGLYNSGGMIQSALKAVSGTTMIDSPEHRLRGTYWDGAASQDMDALIKYVVTSTSPAAELRYYMGPSGAPQLTAILTPAGGGGGTLDLQGGNVINCVNVQSSTAQMVFYANAQANLELAQPADGETAMLVMRNVGAAMTLQRVSMGAADSGGTGYKLLRVPN